MKRSSLFALVAGCLALLITAASAEDKYPSRPIRVLVPYAPGGATDLVARIVSDEFQKITGYGFVVINKPGASGLLAIDEMVKSTPDGYTLMLGNVTTNAITPILYPKKLTANYLRDVVAVTRIIDVPAFLTATTENFPVKTIGEFVAYAKQNPGKLRYGTVGAGSYPHYDMAYLALRAGDLDMAALPNKNGAVGVIQDLLRGDTQVAFLNVASAAPLVQAKQLRPLALVNPTRLPEYPDVPTMQEAGFADVGTLAWQALFAPAGTPKPVLEALYRAVNKAMQSPDVLDKFKVQNFNVVPNKSLDEAQQWLAGELDHWKTMTEKVKIEVAQ